MSTEAHHSRRPFPFSAVVGQDTARQALLVAAVEPALGGVLLRGDKGSAKTTLARGLAALLGPDAPFVELPVGATEDRVFGTLDVQSLLGSGADGPEVVFRPGLLADAHGGVLYVDEVNLLPDHLVDGLLDAAASGTHRVERDGISHDHPARFVLLGSMNPEEGELRPQLLDRFGLSVEVRAPTDPAIRAEAVRRRLTHDRGGPLTVDGAGTTAEAADAELAGRLALARPADLPEDVFLFAAELAVAVGAESLRADLVLCRAAAAVAGWDGRESTRTTDVEAIAPLALGHRRRRRPFDPPTLPPEDLEDALRTVTPPEPDTDEGPGNQEPEDQAGRAGGPDGDGGDGGDGTGPDNGNRGNGNADAPDEARTGAGGRPSTATGKRWDELAGDRLDGEAPPVLIGDDRTATVPPRPPSAPGATGRVTGHGRPGPDGPQGVAVVPTVRAAAHRRAGTGEVTPRVTAEDIREPHRQPPTSRTVVLVVDTSGSMGTPERVAAATGAVVGLLADAYLARDRVALVAFRGDRAVEVLPPTGSVELARARLAELPTGGSTPLADGLGTGLAVARRAAAKQSTPLLVVVTDGRATGGEQPLDRAREAARAVADAEVDALVLDVEDGTGGVRLGLATEMADLMNAGHRPLHTVTAPELESAVRSALGRVHP